MIIKTKQMSWLYLAENPTEAVTVIVERGRGTAAHLHLKAHALKQPVLACSQKWYLQHVFINDL